VKQLSEKFNRLFSIKTGYEQLDERVGEAKKNRNIC